MKPGAIFTAIFLFFTAISLALPDYADAARMGGGRSFGSRPSMSRPAPAPRQTTTQRQATTAPTQTPNRSGMLGGMGGIMGGLLAGTLLGSLLSGHGFAGGGGFMDIILLAILAFIAYKLFQRFRNKSAPQTAEAGAGRSLYNNSVEEDSSLLQRSSTASNAWDNLKSSFSPGGATESQSQQNPNVPAGFDADEFIKGAKMAYTRLQKSWDKRDLEDISQFATGAVMAELQKQLQEDPEPGNTEIMLINAQLLEVEEDGPAERAQVYFDVLMRESPDQQTPENAREIWHFMRMGKNGSWKLDGIQQVE